MAGRFGQLNEEEIQVLLEKTRRPIKFCKGNQILPDITHYVREFTKLPEKLLRSESVENFFSDGTEKNMDETQQISKTKQNSNHEKKDHRNVTCKHSDMSRVSGDFKPDKGAGSIRNHSPKGKYLASFSGKKFNHPLQTSGKLESKKRPPVNPISSTNGTSMSPKDESKPKTVHQQPRTILKSPNPTSPKSSTVNKTVNEDIKTDSSLPIQNNLCTEKLEPERTIAEDIHPKTTSDDSGTQDIITNDSISTTDLNTAHNTDSCMSAACNEMDKTSLTQTSATTLPVVVSSSKASSSSPLVEVTSSISAASKVTSLADISPTQSSSSISSTMTSSSVSTILPSEVMSPELSTAISSSPITIFTSTVSTPSTVTSTITLSHSATMTSSEVASSACTSSTVTSSTSSYVISTNLNMTSTPTITSPTSNTIMSYTKPIMTPFTTHPILTVKSPEVPLTVAVPVLSSLCTTCPVSNQSSSDGSVASSLSRTPFGSPVFPMTPETADVNDNHMFNSSTCLSSGKCKSLESKLCHCENDLLEDQGLDLCDNDIETMKFERNTEKQRLKTAINHLRSTPISGKNGYTRHHHNISQHGLLIVPNGYNHLPSDSSLHFNGYGCHPAEQNHEEMFYEDGFTTHGAKTNDKNCNYIFQNGGHDQTLDFNSNTSYEYKYTPYLNEKSNGFSKPFCYNCGEYGHHGSQCSATELEEPIIS